MGELMGDLYRTAVGFLTILALVAGGVGYCAGRADGRRDARLEANRERIARAAAARETAAEVSREAVERTVVARAERRQARTRIAIVDDTTLTVDDLPVNVPLPVVSVIQKSDVQARTDSVTIVALQEHVRSLEEERDAWRERAQLLKPPTFTFVDGVVIGASAAAATATVIAGSVTGGVAIAVVGGVTVLARRIF